MSRVLVSLLLCSVFYYTEINSARILGVFPVPSISHQVVFRALTLELVNRGHEVVVVTPDPAFKGKEPPANLTEIDISDVYVTMLNDSKSEDYTHRIQRGVIMEWTAVSTAFIKMQSRLMEQLFNTPQVNALIENNNRKFDLVIVEGLFYSHLIFSKIFNAPAVLFNSLYGTRVNFEILGGVALHPIIYPNMFRTKYRDLSVLDKIKQLYVEYKLWEHDTIHEKMENDILKQKFGVHAPSVADLKKYVVLLLTNAHPIFDGNRPVPPAVVYLGALHMKPVKSLPEDLKSYLDNSKRGVIYVSMGTNVRPSEMEKDFLDAFLDAFEALPYDILWKFDGDSLERVPKNVKIQKWFPQRDLLGHPNVKVYVMQGGLQSTDEAIDSEVPLVGIPLLADQWFNADKYVELGIGLSLDSFTMKAEDLVKAVNTVAKDNSYKENMKKLKAIMQDQPEKPIERGVWWVEHVLRHKGSRHLLGPAAQMSWSDYLMIDVLLTLVVAATSVVVIASLAVYYIFKIIFRENNNVKLKQN